MTLDPVVRSRLDDEFTSSPFHAFLGLSFATDADGTVRVRMPFRDELVSDPTVPYLHGGVIGSLLDIAGDYAISLKLGRGVPTIDMRVDYLKVAGKEALTATARIVRLGRSIGVADAEVQNEKGEVIAIGRILYSTREPNPPR